jgi:hypothetical protein
VEILMSEKMRIVLGLVLVFVALMSVFAPVVNAVSQDWYLCTDLTLNKTAPETTSYSLTGWSEWEAEPAQSNLTISEGEWTLHLDCETPAHAEGRLFVEVWNASSMVADKSKYISSSVTINLHIDGINADFKKGESLKLRLNWSSYEEIAQPLKVYCGNSKTKLSSPPTDPGYPIPELSTLVLSSVGLLALAGYVAYRRRFL